MNAREWSLRIADLARRESCSLVDLLLALSEFDRLRAWRQLGHASLFDFLHREVGLSRGSAYYRQVAARLLGKFPEIAEPPLERWHLRVGSPHRDRPRRSARPGRPVDGRQLQGALRRP